jgi:hypothetical protein
MDIVKQEQQTTPAQLIEMAINKDIDINKLKELMQMKKEWDADNARKAFFNALNQFQATVPEITKTKKADFGPGKANYYYAPLSQIVRDVKEPAEKLGLSYRWEFSDNGDLINVTCLITHKDGHTERTTMSCKADVTGSKNPIQARASAIEYMKRYTLIGGLGVTTADSDIDGIMPVIDIDILHKQYIEHYNELIGIDKKFSTWHPDNWRQQPNAKLYAKAIAEIRKKIATLK